MTFLAMGIQKSLLKQQKCQYDYESIVYTNYYNEVEEELRYLTSEEGYDEEDAYYLNEDMKWYQLQMDHCNIMIENLSEQIESYDDAIKDNIKDECSFKLSAG